MTEPDTPDDAPKPPKDAIEYWTEALGDPLFVYFIQAEEGGPVKIGQAQKPHKRLAELQCGNPQNLVIREVLLAAVDTEKRLHLHWRSKAGTRGEWFGRGYEDEILRCAGEASREQMELYPSWPAYYVAGNAAHFVNKAEEAPGWVKA